MMTHGIVFRSATVVCGKTAWRCNWTTFGRDDFAHVTCKQCRSILLAASTVSPTVAPLPSAFEARDGEGSHAHERSVTGMVK